MSTTTQIGTAAIGIGTGLIDDTIGLAVQPLKNAEQEAANQVLTDQQVAANEKLSAFNYQQQYNLWQETNYPAQVDELNKAGLNPALLYGKGGGGGATTGSPSGGIGMGIAPNSDANATAQTMLQAEAVAADVKLKEAQAANLNAKTPQEANVMNAQTANLTQGVQNAKATQMLTEAQTQMQNLQNSITGATTEDAIAQIRSTATSIQQQAQEAVRNNFMDQNTMKDKMQIVHTQLIAMYLNNALTKEQTGLTAAQTDVAKGQINEIASRIMNWVNNTAINQQNADTNRTMVEIQKFMHDLPDSKGAMLRGVTDLIHTFGTISMQ